MKRLILPLLIVFGLTSCQKEELVEPSSRILIDDGKPGVYFCIN